MWWSVTYQARLQSARHQWLRRPDHPQHRASCSLCCCPSPSSAVQSSPPGRDIPSHREHRGEHRSLGEEGRCIPVEGERHNRRAGHRSQGLRCGNRNGRHMRAGEEYKWEHPIRSGRSSRQSTTAGAVQSRLEPTEWAPGDDRKSSCWLQEAQEDARHKEMGCRTAGVVADMEAAVRNPEAAVRTVAGRRAVAVHHRGCGREEGTGCHRTGPEEGSL